MFSSIFLFALGGSALRFNQQIGSDERAAIWLVSGCGGNAIDVNIGLFRFRQFLLSLVSFR